MNDRSYWFEKISPPSFRILTEINTEADILRHIEALWAEIKSLKEEVKILKMQIKKDHPS